MNTVGINLKKLRDDKRWNQATIAAKLNLSVPAYSKMENGVSIMTVTRVKELAEVFKVPLNIILCVASRKDEATEILELKNKISNINQVIIDLRIKAIELYEIISEE